MLDKKKLSNFNAVYVVAIAGNILALTGDTTLTWSSPVLPKLYSNDTSENPLGKPITGTEESWIGSLQYIGAMVGTLPFAYLADKIGRKPTLLILAVPHLIAYLTFAFADHIYWYYFARFLGGISLSSVYVVLPMYVAEISEDSYRGMLLVSFSTFASFGDLLPYITGPYMSNMGFNLLLAMFPAIFVVLFFVLATESPYYYVKRNENFQAELTLIKLRTGSKMEIDNELKQINNEIHNEFKGNIWTTLKRKHVIKGFLIACTLSSLQQLSGLGPILAYTEFIFKAADTSLSPDVSSIIVGLVLFLASFGGPLIVDRKGRKFLLICSSVGIIFSETLLGVYFYLKDKTSYDVNNIYWLPVLCLVIFMVTFNIGYGPLPYTITSEILPANVKFMLATISGFTGWMFSFLVTKFFNDLNNSLGRYGTFWLFSGFCLYGLFFIIFLVPETKGKSFPEIQNELENRNGYSLCKR